MRHVRARRDHRDELVVACYDGCLSRQRERRHLIEVDEGRQDLFSAVDDYERQMFEYGAEAVRSSLEKLPAFAPEAGFAEV